MLSIDQDNPVALVLLDLSAAFDPSKHDNPFFRSKDTFGLSGEVFELF